MSLSRKLFIDFYKYGDWKERHSRNMNVLLTVSNIIMLTLHVNKILLLGKKNLTEEKDSNNFIYLFNLNLFILIGG